MFATGHLALTSEQSMYHKEFILKANKMNLQWKAEKEARQLQSLRTLTSGRSTPHRKLSRSASSAGSESPGSPLDRSFQGMTLPKIHSLTFKPISPSQRKANETMLQTRGRSRYLTEKGRASPEDRYGRPMTSSHYMQWQFPGDEENRRSASKSPFGRKPLVRELFFRENGAFPKANM